LKQIDLDQVVAVLGRLVPKKGKSKSEVARKLGISSQLLGQYMDGRQKPKADFYLKWKSVFGEDLMKYVETNVSEVREDAIEYEVGTPLIKELTKEIKQLKATVHILKVTVAQIAATQNGKAIGSMLVELDRAIDEEADRLFEEDKKNQSRI
jgi:predicted transcriptional regulator